MLTGAGWADGQTLSPRRLRARVAVEPAAFFHGAMRHSRRRESNSQVCAGGPTSCTPHTISSTGAGGRTFGHSAPHGVNPRRLMYAARRDDSEGDTGRFRRSRRAIRARALYEAGEVSVRVRASWCPILGGASTTTSLAYADRLGRRRVRRRRAGPVPGPVASTIEEAAAAFSLDRRGREHRVGLRRQRGGCDRHRGGRPPRRIGWARARRWPPWGFSMGAVWAMWTPAERDRSPASVVYYGRSRARASLGPRFRSSAISLRRTRMSPMRGRRVREHAPLRGRDVVIHRYPGTGHWFRNRRAMPTGPRRPISPSTGPSPSWVSTSRRRVSVPQSLIEYVHISLVSETPWGRRA